MEKLILPWDIRCERCCSLILRDIKTKELKCVCASWGKRRIKPKLLQKQ